MPQVVLLASSCTGLPGTTRRLGVSLSQLGLVRQTFRSAGWAVRLATPAGGPVPVDAGTLSEEWFEATRYCLRAESIADVEPATPDAWLVLGGHAGLCDLVGLAELERRLETAAQLGRTVAALDHGGAALAAVAGRLRRDRRRPYRLTGRTDEEEHASRHLHLLPRSSEQVIRSADVSFVAGPAWQPYVVTDGPFVSGQNPASASAVVDAVIARDADRALAA
ncbi:type 1 glutamine amidotransferase family protein [Microlunatus ginsengisoli]|uniref:Intracellular protease/amidase n=1 Tax=Microlunatus ginsengisoli TaxID=363863 RepID=A0ABP7A0E0_9ACTN